MPKTGQIWDARFLERSALLADLQAVAQPLLRGSTWPSLEACSALVDDERRSRAPELPALRFAPPRARSRSQPIDIGQLYDGRIALHAEVPCLGTSYHDLLNVLVWAAFPRTNHALHRRQYRALSEWLPPAAARLPNRRTREQDALALFDEGGSVLVRETRGLSEEPRRGSPNIEEGPSAECSIVPNLGHEVLVLSLAKGARLPAAPAPGLVEVPRGAALEPARILLFGHAVMEHLCFESSELSSAALVVCLEPPLPHGRELLDRVDRALAARIADVRELAAPSFDAVLAIEPPDRTEVRLERVAS